MLKCTGGVPRRDAAGASPQLNKIESVRLVGDGDSTRATQRCLLTTHSCSRSSGRPIEDYLRHAPFIVDAHTAFNERQAWARQTDA
jgi:hypothetical protein